MKKYSTYINDIFAGTLSGFLIIIMATAFSAIIFKDSLYPFFSIGISCALLGAIIGNTITSFLGNIPYSITRSEPAVAAILALIFSKIALYPLDESALLSTLIATTVIVSVFSGILMFLLGYFKLGQSFRFIPYPVLGGFLAGSGSIILYSTLQFICNNHLTVQYILQAHVLMQLSIGIGIALIALFAKRFWILLLLIATGCILINIYFQMIYHSHEYATQTGWFFSSFKPTLIFNLGDTIYLNRIDWTAIGQLAGYIISIPVLIIMILLFNETGLELAENISPEFDQELKTCGLANIIGGLTGCFPSNLSLSGTILNKNIGGSTRISSIVASCICLVAFLLYPNIVSYLPIPVVSGLLFFISGRLIIVWLYYGWFSLIKIDYLIVASIWMMMTFWNFISGIFIGILITCIVSIFQFAKINIIKLSTSGKYYHSNVIRAPYQQAYLVDNGSKIRVFKLQGYLFFGSIKLFLDDIIPLILNKREIIEFLIFDFKQIHSLDSSAGFGWIRLLKIIDPTQQKLIFTNCSEYVTEQLDKHNLFNSEVLIYRFSTLDQGLEWCEEQLLKKLSLSQTISATILDDLIPDKNQQHFFIQQLEKFEIASGEYLFKQGEPSDSLYFIESGEVSVQLKTYTSEIRLAKYTSGSIIGEMGFYLNIFRTASIYAETNCIGYKLNQDIMKKIEEHYPNIALIFYKNFIPIMANRLVQTNYLLQILN